MTKTIRQTSFKARLLSGSSMAAVLAIGVGVGVISNEANAVAVTSVGAANATAILSNATAIYATAGAFGSITTTGTAFAVPSVTVTESGTLYVNDATSGNITMNTIAITSGKTLDVKLGFNDAGAAGAVRDTALMYQAP